jgi:hypothetical protein
MKQRGLSSQVRRHDVGTDTLSGSKIDTIPIFETKLHHNRILFFYSRFSTIAMTAFEQAKDKKKKMAKYKREILLFLLWACVCAMYYLAPWPYQQKNFTIHSISYTDYKWSRFPLVAILAREWKPFIAETHYNNGTTPAVSIFLGPGKPYYPPGVDTTDEKNLVWPTANATEAHCTLRNYDHSLHHETPHNFQQLLRCFSWWQMPINKGKQPVLYIQKWGHDGATKEYKENSTEGFGYIHAYYHAMAEAFHVRLEIERRNLSQHVRKNEIYVEAPWQGDMDTSTNAYGMQTPYSVCIKTTDNERLTL